MLLTFLRLISLSASCLASAVIPYTTHELAARAICTPKSGGSSSIDDTPAIEAAIAECGAGGTIVIPAGTTYFLNTQLTFTGCVSCDFQIEGTLRFTDDTTYWNGKSFMMEILSTTKATIQSVTRTGLIDYNGQTSYDLYNADMSYSRPTGLRIHGSTGTTFTGLTIFNTPAAFLSVEGNSVDTTISNIRFSAVSSSSSIPYNTDGFDIGESTNTFMSNIVVNNDDDCIAFKPGANFVSVDGVSCNGSHGISVGSLGETPGVTDSVTNVYVKNAVMSNSAKASGIKLWPGQFGSAIVSNMTWDTFTIDNDGYAAQIQQCYGVTATTSACLDNPSTAKLTDVTWKNFVGTTSTEYGSVAIANLNCPGAGICDISLSNFSVHSPSGAEEFLCANIDGNPGVECTSGANG